MDTSYREDVVDSLSKLIGDMPGVKLGKAFGHPAFKNGRKVFCFVGGDGIALKLPGDKVSELVKANKEMSIFEPEEGTQWKEWVEIDRKQAADYSKDMELFQESIAYVAS